MIWTTAALLVTLAFARVSPNPTLPIEGGITNTSIDIPEVRDALNFAVNDLNRNSDYMSEVVKVISATAQVVEGMMYRFKLEMAILGCKPWAQQKCADNPELKKLYTCNFQVWTRAWLDSTQTINDCNGQEGQWTYSPSEY